LVDLNFSDGAYHLEKNPFGDRVKFRVSKAF